MQEVQIAYNPFGSQIDFHLSTAPKVYLSGGYGCVGKGTLIETIKGQIPIEDITQPTLVRSWDNEKKKFIWAPCTPSFSVGLKQEVCLSYEGGQLICAESHLIFSSHYKYKSVSLLKGVSYLDHASDSSPLLTISEFFQQVSLLDVPHLKKIAVGFLSCYLLYLHQYDLLLQKVLDTVQDVFPLQADVQGYTHSNEHLDGFWEIEPLYTRLIQHECPLSMLRYVVPKGHPLAVWASQALTLHAECISDLALLWRLFLSKKFVRHSNSLSDSSYQSSSDLNIFPCKPVTTYNTGRQVEMFDIHVLKTNSYIANGLIHHNSGKTYSLVMKMLDLASINQGLSGGLLVPNLKMFKRDVKPTIEEICEDNGIPYRFHKTDFNYYFPDTKSTVYVFHSEDDGASIRGPNLAYFCINEVTMCSKGAFDAAIARVRLRKAKLLQVAMSGTPEGFNWTYEYFIENKRADTDLFYSNSVDNPHVADTYVQMLRDSYDDIMAQAYIEGKHVNLNGKAAVYKFDRRRHVSDEAERNLLCPVWVTLDFNVDPMSAVLWNRLPPDHKHWLYAFDEIKISGSNTYEICQEIWRRVGKDEMVIIYPDPAGRARSTKTRVPTSDISILKSEGFTNIKYKPKIHVRDCLNSLNNLFHKDRILINSRCKNFITDLEQCVLKDGIFELDKSNPKRTHWLDGAKNMADYEFPVKRRTESYIQQIR